MKDKFPLPDQKNYQYAYQFAYQLAAEQLTSIDHLEQQCRNSGAQYQAVGKKRAVIVDYLDKPYRISVPDVAVSAEDSPEPVPLRDQLLILHYFIQAKGTPLSRKLITYKELPEGLNYFPTFAKRTIKPLVDYFGAHPQWLVDTAHSLGGRESDIGDAGVVINAFSRVQLTLAVWQGDDELSPEGSILFDSTIQDYLHTEDIHVLCETIIWRLVRQLRNQD